MKLRLMSVLGSLIIYSSCLPFDLEEVGNEKCEENNIIEIEMNKIKTFKLPKGTEKIMVGDPKIADAHVQDESSFSISGEKNGETTIKLMVKDPQGNKRIINKRIVVSFNLTQIKNGLKKHFPKADISIDNYGNFIALTGTVDTPKMASDVMEFVGKVVGNERNIINNMTIAVPTQVMLKVKVAKLDRSVSKSLGINWRTFSLGSSFNILGLGGTSGGVLPAILTSASAVSANIANTGVKQDISTSIKDQSPSTPTSGHFLGGNDPTVPVNGARWYMSYSDNASRNISAVIDALAEESLATVLAEPTLVALSGQEAQFQSGGEQPYRDSSTTGTASSVEFKDWGIMLKFTPNVISENRISINVDSEISSVENSNGEKGEPPLAKQNVKTTVELGSGQSLAIAGLLKKETNKTATELPGLAKIPILGGLFRSGSDSLKESELVIIVTPYIVRPSSKQLVTPVERAPKMLSPCRSIFNRKFVSEDKNVTNNAGFTVS